MDVIPKTMKWGLLVNGSKKIWSLQHNEKFRYLGNDDCYWNYFKLFEFEKWRKVKTKGKGLSIFTECPKINRNMQRKVWVMDFILENGWKCSLKSCNEVKPLPHVLSSSNQGELIRLNRQNNTKKIIEN